MTRPPRPSPGLHWIKWTAVMSVAATAGFWCGSRQQAKTNDAAASGEIAGGSKARRMTESPTEILPAERVRKAIEGRLDGDRLWPEVRRLSAEEVTAAIGELGRPETFGGVQDFTCDLPAMLFYRWGELNPVAANEAAKSLLPKHFPDSRQAVIAAWIKQGGGIAAWNAVRDEGEIWDCTRSVPVEVADMLVASFSDLDDATAFREVGKFNDENSLIAGKLCRARARKATATPGTRAAFLAAAATHPDPYVASCAYEYLFKEWAEIDPGAALEGTADPTIPEDEREEMRNLVMEAMKSAAERAAAEAP
jgi:hypothetical protein